MALINFLFVYGTLLRSEDGNLHPLLKNDATYTGDAILTGHLFEIAGYPGAVPDRSSVIHGQLYELQRPALTLQRLDDYEECSTNFPAPHEYHRVTAMVTMEMGQQINAWVYFYNRPTHGLYRINSGDYRRFLREHG